MERLLLSKPWVLRCNEVGGRGDKVLSLTVPLCSAVITGFSWCSIAPLKICTSHLPGENLHAISTGFELLLKTVTFSLEPKEFKSLLTNIGLFPVLSFSFPLLPASHFSAFMSASLHSGQIGNFPFFCSTVVCMLLPKGYWLQTEREGDALVLIQFSDVKYNFMT